MLSAVAGQVQGGAPTTPTRRMKDGPGGAATGRLSPPTRPRPARAARRRNLAFHVRLASLVHATYLRVTHARTERARWDSDGPGEGGRSLSHHSRTAAGRALRSTRPSHTGAQRGHEEYRGPRPVAPADSHDVPAPPRRGSLQVGA